MYSETVMDHFKNPRNIGEIDGWNAVGKVGNPVCGDVMYIYIRVDGGKIEDIGFKTMGCGAAIATSSMITELAKGKSLDEAYAITKDDVAQALDGLPPVKMHCSNLASDGLRKAIDNFRSGKPEGESKEEILGQFKSIPGLSDPAAETLYDAGFHGMDELRRTSEEEYANVEGINSEDVSAIKRFFQCAED